MRTEIEAKLKVESHEKLKARLAELGGEFLGEQVHRDCYFDNADRELAEGDRCLRVRRALSGGSEKILLTYKGAREKGHYKKRPEAEVEVNDCDSLRKMLLAIGYEEALVFEKKRLIWRLDDCEVSLDELPLLGCFVEIEGPGESEIAKVQQRLGLGNSPHIPESYAVLMEKELVRLGKKEKEVLLRGT